MIVFILVVFTTNNLLGFCAQLNRAAWLAFGNIDWMFRTDMMGGLHGAPLS
jgi:hypothetical protein